MDTNYTEMQYRFVLHDPNSLHEDVYKSDSEIRLMTQSEADSYNKTLRRDGYDLRWIKATS